MQFFKLALPLFVAASFVAATPISQGDSQLESLSRREPLNAAAMVGLTAGSVLKGIFGNNKEAQDAFLASDVGKEFVSKLASNDGNLSSRDVDSFSEADSMEKRLSFGTGFKLGLKVFGSILGGNNDNNN